MNAKDWGLLALGVVVAALLGWTVANLTGLAGTHEHAELAVHLNSSEPYDFSAERYQLAAREVHLEEGADDADGATIHMHAEDLTLRDFFTSIGWDVSQQAIVTDTGERYPVDEDHQLAVAVDGEPARQGFDVPLEDGASYVVRYGPASADG